MKTRFTVGYCLLLSALVWALGGLAPARGADTLITAGSVWKYQDAGLDLGTAWRDPGLDDSAWPAGPAQLGFGDGDEATRLRTTNIITAYFRQAFTVTDAPSVTNLVVRLLRDDGAVVYLNGVEVFRSNLPVGPVTYTTLALSAVGGADETNFFEATIPPALLVSGQNLIAVEIHQNAVSSTDLSFDLALIGNGPPPAVRPQIVTQPQGQRVLVGSDVTFTVVATGTEPLSYQWRYYGTPLTNATGPSLTLYNVQTNQAGNYSVVVANSAGSVTSSNALLRVVLSTNPPPTIVTQPLSQTVLVGSDVTFTVEATSVEPMTYQWRFNGISLIGGTSASLTLSNVQTNQAGNYSVVVENLAGGVLSSNAQLRVLTSTNPQPPVVTLTFPPNGAVFTMPTNIGMTASASDADGWITKVEFLAGATLVAVDTVAPYSVVWTNVTAGTFQLTAAATDNDGNVTVSAPVTITVQAPQPTYNLTLLPRGSIWKYLDNGTDQGTAWREVGFDDSPWASGPAQLGYGDGDEATIVNYGPDPMNRYITTYFRSFINLNYVAGLSNVAVRLLRDDGGVVYINGVEVARQNMPAGTITYSTLALTAVGGTDEVSFFDSPVPPGVLVAGQNLIAVEIHQSTPTSSDLSFDLELVANGSTNPPPVRPQIVTQPQSQKTLIGSDVTFTVMATGTEPLSYRWRRDGYIIPNSSGPTLTLYNVQTNNNGNYSVVVSNLAGAVTSSNAALHVVMSTNPQPPFVTLTAPTNGASFPEAQGILLSASASDMDGWVTRVEFFAGGTRLAIDTTAPYSAVWSNAPLGTYQLTAAATDDNGNVAVSSPVTITVRPKYNLTLLPRGSVWKYLDNGTDQGTAWRDPGFDDSAWASGPAQLGYGDGDEATIIGFGPDPMNHAITTYFRRLVTVNNVAGITNLAVRLLRDDGGVVYINGVEVARQNMPAGPVTYATLAYNAADEIHFFDSTVPPGVLVEGLNLIAVEIHQASATSGDLSFDLELAANGTTNPPPAPPVITAQPQDQTVLVGADVTFSVTATGTPPLFYSWEFNGSPILATTNPTLTLVNVQPDQAGWYSVMVTNLAGRQVSSNALLTVLIPNRPPVADPQTVTLNEDAAAAITLTGSDPDGDALTFTVLSPPAHSTLSGTPPDLVYAPSANYFGPDSFTFKVNDGEYDSETATITINVLPVNDLPVAVASAGPALQFLSASNHYVILSINSTNATVTFDGTLSSDIDNDPLEFFWVQQGVAEPLAGGPQAAVPLPTGDYAIDLLVSDGVAIATNTINVEVITLCEGTGGIVLMVLGSSLPVDIQRELVIPLGTACHAFEGGRFGQGVDRLQRFQDQVVADVTPLDAALAEKLFNAAQELIDAVNPMGALKAVKGHSAH